MAITKFLIWGAAVNRFTAAARVLSQCGTAIGWSIRGLMEKIVSKTNDTEKTCELNDAELAAVSGGLVNDAVAGAIAGAQKGVPVDQGGPPLPGLPCDPVLFIFCPVVP
jgi:lactobin A/cerein 7B family class IIb bacteriocin